VIAAGKEKKTFNMKSWLPTTIKDIEGGKVGGKSLEK